MSTQLTRHLSATEQVDLSKQIGLPYIRLILFLALSVMDFFLTKWLL